MSRKQFTFYHSYYEAIQNMRTKTEKLQAFEVLCDYALYQIEPDVKSLKPAVAAFFQVIKPSLESAYRRSVAAREKQPLADTDAELPV